MLAGHDGRGGARRRRARAHRRRGGGAASPGRARRRPDRLDRRRGGTRRLREPAGARRRGALLGQARGRNRVVAATEDDDSHSSTRERAGGEQAAVPRHLRSMLALSRAAASGAGVLSVLEALAHTIRSELSFQVVAINLLDEERAQMHVLLVDGDEEARQALLGTASSWPEWEAMMTPDHIREGASWLAAGTYEWEDERPFWTPPAAAAPLLDAWHPEDMLMLPLRGGVRRDHRDGLARPAASRPAPGRRGDRGADGGRRPGWARDRAGPSHRCRRNRRVAASMTNYAWRR